MSKRTPNKGKSGLHVRNPHKGSYDFEKLCRVSSELKAFIYQAPNGRDSIKFSDPDAVKALNKALLKAFYQIEFWDLPPGYLCPPIPGRADYIHHLADLLGDANVGVIPRGADIRGLDIGTGANVIYPILGSQSYGWSFIGSDIDPVSIATAEQISKFNPVLKKKIRCRLQKSQENIFKGVIQQDERFDFTLCNPPFHASLEEATAGSKRKVRNLSKASGKEAPEKLELNFAGQGAELWCKGGEVAFVRKMINESAEFAENCLWFTCLISKKDNLPAVYKALKGVKAKTVKTVDMAQGQKISRFVAWSFYTAEQRQQWALEFWKK